MDAEAIYRDHAETITRGGLSIWTVMWDASDHPGVYCARLSKAVSGRLEMTDQVMTANTLTELRAPFEQAGLTPLARHPDDEPHIVEVWM